MDTAVSSFEQACEVEKLAEAVLLPYMQRVWPSCTYYPTRHHRIIQKVCGDLLVQKTGSAKYIELKAERQNDHGNLFVETWSNKSRGGLGWFHACQADWLWYYFLKPSELYILQMDQLREWARQPMHRPRLYDFPEKNQRRYVQMNDTWGRPVPIEILKREVAGFCGPIDPTAVS